MQAKESESDGNLADYIARGLDEAARQKAEAERQTAEAQDRARRVWFQRTAPLRAHLMELSKPLDILFARLGIKELLEEVQTQFPQGGTVRKLEPQIYRDIVSQPDISKTGFYLLKPYKHPNSLAERSCDWATRGLIALASLLEPNDFPALVDCAVHTLEASNSRPKPDPADEGYGYGLELKEKRKIVVNGRVLRNSRSERYVWLGPGAGSKIIVSEGGDYWATTSSRIQVYETSVMVVEAILTPSWKLPYDLVYSYMGKYRHPDSGETETRYLTPPVRILRSRETLKKLIANDIVRERTDSMPT